MAAPYPNAVTVGSYFVGQYYQVLRQQPDFVHQFYGDASSMIRIDGDSTKSASSIQDIHALATSLNFSSIEIKTINSLDSFYGGILVMVSGSVRTKDASGSRKFVQTFFLAPQEKGFFVLNDMFQYVEDEIVYQQHPAHLSSKNVHHQHTAPIAQEDIFETELNSSSPLPEQPEVSDYVLEEKAREYVRSIPIEDDPLGNYSLPEHQQEEYEDESEEELPVQELPASYSASANAVEDTLAAAPEEHVDEPPQTKKSYAAILQASKGQLPSPVATQPPVNRIAPTTSDWNHVAPPATQQYQPASTPAPQPVVEAAEEGYGLDEGESKSVYVRNLPSNVTAAEIKQEFLNFGRLRPDGVVIKSHKDAVGVYYAFVEFEDLLGVQNAIKASPITLAGRQVHIEERRPKTGIASRGGRGRGRGRGGYQDASRGRFAARGSGRGNDDESGDYSRSRGNGYYQRGSR